MKKVKVAHETPPPSIENFPHTLISSADDGFSIKARMEWSKNLSRYNVSVATIMTKAMNKIAAYAAYLI